VDRVEIDGGEMIREYQEDRRRDIMAHGLR
jgi:hypothetical protein